jgi:hypothetical protein
MPGFEYPAEYDDGVRREQRASVKGEGYVYSGEWENGQPNGRGVFEGAHGAWKYEGFVLNGVPHFYGRFYNPGKRHVVEGRVSSGNFHGHGKVFKIDGTFLEGYFCNGELYHGLAEYPDGSSYTGEFKKDLPWGQGLYSWKDGTLYEGTFEAGELRGQGKLVLAGVTYAGLFRGVCTASPPDLQLLQAPYKCYPAH